MSKPGANVISSVSPVACGLCHPHIVFSIHQWDEREMQHPPGAICGTILHHLFQPFAEQSCSRLQNGELSIGLVCSLLVLALPLLVCSNVVGEKKSLLCKKCSFVWTTGCLVNLLHPIRVNAFLFNGVMMIMKFSCSKSKRLERCYTLSGAVGVMEHIVTWFNLLEIGTWHYMKLHSSTSWP